MNIRVSDMVKVDGEWAVVLKRADIPSEVTAKAVDSLQIRFRDGSKWWVATSVVEAHEAR